MTTWLTFPKYANPFYYVLSTLFSLEFGTNERIDCGETCERLLKTIDYDEANYLKTTIILAGLLLLMYFTIVMAFYVMDTESTLVKIQTSSDVTKNSTPGVSVEMTEQKKKSAVHKNV
eukprot:UN04004